MTSTQMYEHARNVIVEHENIKPDDDLQPDVLWVGGIFENKKGIVWYGDKIFMVNYNLTTGIDTIETYVKQNGEDELNDA